MVYKIINQSGSKIVPVQQVSNFDQKPRSI